MSDLLYECDFLYICFFTAKIAAFFSESYRKDFRTFTYFFIAVCLKFSLEILWYDTGKLFHLNKVLRKSIFIFSQKKLFI
jgi:hypothetical protein